MATLATPAEVRTAAPEFTGLSDPVIQSYIDMADTEIDADAWGSRAKRAEVVLTCHLMTIYGALTTAGGAGGAASGAVQSIRVGEVSLTYAAPAAAIPGDVGGASLELSRYGQEYARLIRLAAYGAALAC